MSRRSKVKENEALLDEAFLIMNEVIELVKIENTIGLNETQKARLREIRAWTDKELKVAESKYIKPNEE